jgi:hypothetical protein
MLKLAITGYILRYFNSSTYICFSGHKGTNASLFWFRGISESSIEVFGCDTICSLNLCIICVRIILLVRARSANEDSYDFNSFSSLMFRSPKRVLDRITCCYSSTYFISCSGSAASNAVALLQKNNLG